MHVGRREAWYGCVCTARIAARKTYSEAVNDIYQLAQRYVGKEVGEGCASRTLPVLTEPSPP